MCFWNIVQIVKKFVKYCLKTKNFDKSGKIFSQSFSLELLANYFLKGIH
jgi:hypothetical protein